MVSDIEVPPTMFNAYEDITNAAPIMLDDTNHRNALKDILETTGAEQ
ncbi:MAG: hypothetical protein IMZ58_11860 [Thermoplasmata archaeon]|nr:hypothetical protein [Thermoplasmata archaeon]